MFGVVILIAHLFSSTSSAADGRPVDCVIPVKVNTTNIPASLRSKYTQDLYRAAYDWNMTDANFKLQFVDWNFKEDRKKGAVTVSFTSVEQLEENQLAITWNKSLGGGINRSMIEFELNEKYCTDENESADCISLYNLALHELGHALGLKHNDDPNSIMYRAISPGVKKKKMTLADIERIEQIYSWDSAGCVYTAQDGLTWGIE